MIIDQYRNARAQERIGREKIEQIDEKEKLRRQVHPEILYSDLSIQTSRVYSGSKNTSPRRLCFPAARTGEAYFWKISTLRVVFFKNFLTQSPVRSDRGAIINPLECLYYGKIKIAQAPRNRTRWRLQHLRHPSSLPSVSSISSYR